jgi:uncharacterized protein (DUF433 family)
MAPYNDIRLTGHRIGLYHVIYYHREQGYDAAQLHEEFPTLSVELLNKVLEFYRQNREEVDAYVRYCQEEIDRQRATGKHIDIEELRRRMRDKKRIEAS